MKLKRYVACLCFAALLVLEGCSSYEYFPVDSSLDWAKVFSAYWAPADSALHVFADDAENSGMYAYTNYTQKDKSLIRDTSKDSLLFKFSTDATVGLAKDVFSIRVDLEYRETNKGYRFGTIDAPLLIDIYGCNDYACKNANKIVVHDKDYSFTKLLEKDDFEISKPVHGFYVPDGGYDCDVTKDYHFHLKIDLDDVKVDLDAQKGSKSCYERNSRWCVYC